jgi:hypothetical protein
LATRISLVPYADLDSFPQQISTARNSHEPIHLSTGAEVQAALISGELPGDDELLDAWALYYRGRFGDAIRSLVTSIEVVLEANFKAALIAKGLTTEQVNIRLEKSFNNFEVRLSEYLNFTHQRMPGPLLSILPWINGIRLKWELDATRHLRHQIVHAGLRLDGSLRGPLMRAMETTSWLFNWFRKDSPIHLTGNQKHSALKGSMLGLNDMLDCMCTYEGVVVLQCSFPSDAPIIDGTIGGQLADLIDENKPDIEAFSLTCFGALKYRIVETPRPELVSPFLIYEEYCLLDSAKRTLVFLVDKYELFQDEVLFHITARTRT